MWVVNWSNVAGFLSLMDWTSLMKFACGLLLGSVLRGAERKWEWVAYSTAATILGMLFWLAL